MGTEVYDKHIPHVLLKAIPDADMYIHARYMEEICLHGHAYSMSGVTSLPLRSKVYVIEELTMIGSQGAVLVSNQNVLDVATYLIICSACMHAY